MATGTFGAGVLNDVAPSDGTDLFVAEKATEIDALESTALADPASVDRIVANGDMAARTVDEIGAWTPSISADGQRIVFATVAPLVPEDNNGKIDFYLKDFTSGVLTRVSVGGGGTQADGDSLFGTLSRDGTKLLFCSAASNLVPDDTNGQVDVFLKNLVTGEVQRVSTRADGSQAYNGESVEGYPTFSPDGQQVLFTSFASDLVAGDTNGRCDVFIKNLATGAIQRVSVGSDGLTQGNDGSSYPSFSPDGRSVVFYTDATSFASDSTGEYIEAYVKDLNTGALTRVSTSASGELANGDINEPYFSADGRAVFFTSIADNLVTGDTNQRWDVFRKDLVTGEVTRISVAADGSEATGGSGFGGEDWSSGSWLQSISADGRYVTFSSDATNLVPGDTNGVFDVFVKDMVTNEVVRASVSATGTQADDASALARLSADGRYLVFESLASNLVAGDTNGLSDLFRVANPFSTPVIAAPVITACANDTGASSSDGITRDNTQAMTITAAPGVTVQVFDGAASLGFASETSSQGVYQFTTAALADGAHAFMARASSALGTSSYSAAKLVTIDTLGPSGTLFSPHDGETGVGVARSVVVSFSEAIQRGSGSIVLRNAAGVALETYDVASNQTNLSISGLTLVVDPSIDLAYGSGYRLDFAPGCVTDVAGNPYAGTTGYDFATDDYADGVTTAGWLAVDGSASGAVEFAGDGDWFAVSLDAGGAYRFRLSGTGLADPLLLLYAPGGAQVSGDDDSGGGRDARIDYVAPSSGMYYLGATGAAGGTGRYAISATSIVADDFAGEALTAGSVASGGMTSGEIEVPGDVDWFAVTLSAGTRYLFRADAAASDGVALGDPFLTLNAASGIVLAQDDDGGGDRNSLIDHVAERDGTFYLAVRDSRGGTGRYTVSASPVSADDYPDSTSTPGRVTVGGATHGYIDWDEDRDWFGVTLAAGASYQFRLAATDLADPLLRVYAPDGSTLLASDDDGGGGRVALIGFTATAAGTYFLAAADAGTGSGGYVVSALRVATDDYPNDAGTTGMVSLGAPSAGRIEACGDVDWFAMNVSAGMHYQFRMVGDGSIDPYLTLATATGIVLAHDDDSGGGANALIDYVAAAQGTLFLAARDAGSRTGGYALSAVAAIADDYPANPATAGQLAVGGSVTGSIETAGDRDWFAVPLVSGQSYRLELTGGSLDDPVLALYSGPTTVVGWNDDRTPGDRDSAILYTASATGTYYLDVSGFGGDHGSYTLSASVLPPPDDYAGDASTSGRIAAGNTQIGRVETIGDVDWFAVPLSAHVSYQFQLNGEGVTDPYLRLYASDGIAALADDDDGGGANDALLRYTPETSGTYFLAVSDRANSTGGYALQAAFEPSTGDTSFSIELVFVLPTEHPEYAHYLPYFEAAAQRWQQVITADTPDVIDTRYGSIDDLRIDVSIEAIDGINGTLGGGAALDQRAVGDKMLPYYGQIIMDVDDLAVIERQGVLLSVIQHEMGHVLGFSHGYLPLNHLVDPNDPYRYIGSHALDAYRMLAGTPSLDAIPLESEGGPGTRGGHWDEDLFGRELMTGSMESSLPQPLSILTVGALQDLGYGVSYDMADLFVL